MGLEMHYDEGQTPLDEEEKERLLIQSVTTRRELDEVEQRNIEEAIRWTFERRKRFTASEILTEACFANGNGRHSRLMADIIAEKIFKKSVFTWGGYDLVQTGESRAKYLKALREADKGNITALIQFARS